VQLFTYHASSASYRVRIALELKGLAREDILVDLKAAAHHDASYKTLNPNARVPFLVDGDVRAGQSLAILEYLEEAYPEPPILPTYLAGRLRVREIALVIAADIQPLQNSSVIAYLADPIGASPEQTSTWFKHWIARGLDAAEAMLADHPQTGLFCHGDTPTVADICLVPQLFNWTHKANGTLDAWPTLSRIHDHCQSMGAFQRAHPLNQPDAPKD